MSPATRGFFHSRAARTFRLHLERKEKAPPGRGFFGRLPARYFVFFAGSALGASALGGSGFFSSAGFCLAMIWSLMPS